MPNIKIIDKYEHALWERDLYTASVDYIISENIYEYDIRNAGLNLCIYYNLLPQDMTDYLQSIGKRACTIKIGRLMKDDTAFSKKLTEAFAKMRKLFFIANELDDTNILSIKKDAIFIINRKCENVKFRNIEFVLKNKYTSFHAFNKYEYYYRNKGNILDVKGINDRKLVLHEEFMLTFLKDVFRSLEIGDSKRTISKIKKFAYEYKMQELDIGYYRELNAKSRYVLTTHNENMDIHTDGYVDGFSLNVSYNYINYILILIQRFFFIRI